LVSFLDLFPQGALDHGCNIHVIVLGNPPMESAAIAEEVKYVSLLSQPMRPARHARAHSGHPRLRAHFKPKTWMAGTSPAMTGGEHPAPR
jgi:hypothetical protein